MKLRPFLLVFLALLGTLVVGCNPYSLGDSIDVDLDFSPLSSPSDDLHLPYVLGAQVTISVRGAEEAEQQRMTLESSDPSVLRIDSQDSGNAKCTAASAGSSTIRVSLDGSVVTESEILVMAPTSFDLTPHGPLLAKRPDAMPIDGRLQILTGGLATFLVTYYAGDLPLFGNGVLDASAETGVSIEEQTTFFFENRDWLQLTPLSPGEHAIAIRAGGVDLGSAAIHAMNDEDVDHIRILQKDESDAEKGEELTLLAQAYDSDGRPIYGVEYLWDVDGLQESGSGDLYRYTYSENEDRKLTAQFGDLRDSLDIHSSGGFVDSSNNLGCSAAPEGSFGDLSWLLVAAMVSLPLTRSRRRSHSRK